MTTPLHNDEGHISGAKSILVLAALIALAWLIRDLVGGRDMTEVHAALIGGLLMIGLLNRISSRGQFRLKIGRDGAELTGGDK